MLSTWVAVTVFEKEVEKKIQTVFNLRMCSKFCQVVVSNLVLPVGIM